MWKPFTWHEEITNDAKIVRVQVCCGVVRLLLPCRLNLVNSLLETQSIHYFMNFHKLINVLHGHFFWCRFHLALFTLVTRLILYLYDPRSGTVLERLSSVCFPRMLDPNPPVTSIFIFCLLWDSEISLFSFLLYFGTFKHSISFGETFDAGFGTLRPQTKQCGILTCWKYCSGRSGRNLVCASFWCDIYIRSEIDRCAIRLFLATLFSYIEFIDCQDVLQFSLGASLRRSKLPYRSRS